MEKYLLIAIIIIILAIIIFNNDYDLPYLRLLKCYEYRRINGIVKSIEIPNCIKNGKLLNPGTELHYE